MYICKAAGAGVSGAAGWAWLWGAGAGGAALLALLAAAACWLRRRRNGLHHKLGGHPPECRPRHCGERTRAVEWALVNKTIKMLTKAIAGTISRCGYTFSRVAPVCRAPECGKRGPDKALVFQPPRRATAVRSPSSNTHYLRKSPSPTAAAPAPPAPPAPAPPAPAATPLANNHAPGSGGLSPQSPRAAEPAPLSKELADAAATEKTTTPPDPENEGKLGDLHFKLRYENEKSALVVSVVSCQELPGREPAGPDPYVKLQLLPDKQHKVKTRVVRKTRCPVYDEDFTFYGLPPHQLANITLHFVVLSFDRYSRDEIIGEVVAPLAGLQLHAAEPMALCREIQPRSLKVHIARRHCSC
ncbi:Synaptotagmin-11 [Eumeta japonica]|uniref:Synaptotagmin-11 n=1 Tax=Eumeta variegata TaxID=151549 RepID=A0A4C1SXZ5_EUMVA|nr:Synaptotagmin-11 [Eumeta japonica]